MWCSVRLCVLIVATWWPCLTAVDTGPLTAQLGDLLGGLGSPRPPPSCPPSWSQHGRSCYPIPSERRTWPAANQACARLDRRAHLAIVRPDNIQQVSGLLRDARHVTMWIGLLRVSSRPSAFGWVDGTRLHFDNWLPGEPNNYFFGTEHCVEMFGVRSPSSKWFKWNDIWCSRRFHYICQIRMSDQ